MFHGLLFLNFCLEEGFSLPAAEAMSCGCIVIGNHGYGAREFMLPEFSFPIPQGDIIQFAQTVEHVVTDFDLNPAAYLDRAKDAAGFINQNYSLDITKKELLQFWEGMMVAA